MWTAVERADASTRGAASCADGGLEVRAGGELGNAGGGDLHRLAGARVHPLARAALGHRELPEPRERHFAASAEDVLDGAERGVDRVGGLLAREVRTGHDRVHELS